MAKQLLHPSELLEAACSSDEKELMKLLHVNSTDQSQSKYTRASQINLRDENGQTALHLAVNLNNIEAIQNLVNAGADINVRSRSYYMTPLMYAVDLNRASCISELLNLGADTMCIDSEGRNALMLAAESNHYDSLRALVNAGADLNLQTKKLHFGETYVGRTALMYAVQCQHIDCIKLLLKAGADVNAKTSDGLTALHWAARFYTASDDVSDCMRILLEYGADCNAGTSDGETPLMTIVSDTYLFQTKKKLGTEFVNILINGGTDLRKEDRRGRTVLMLAAQSNWLRDVLPMLVEAGSVVDQ